MNTNHTKFLAYLITFYYKVFSNFFVKNLLNSFGKLCSFVKLFLQFKKMFINFTMVKLQNLFEVKNIGCLIQISY